MKQYLRGKIAGISSYIEIALSIILLVGIVIISVELVKDIIDIANSLFDTSVQVKFESFLGDALKLIIGVEFVKMLAKHTPESVIEVLLFAIARKLIVGNSTTIDMVVGVGAIAVLFAVRKYLYSSNWSEQPSGSRISSQK